MYLDRNIPAHLEENLNDDEPDDDPLEPGGVPHLELVAEPVQGFGDGCQDLGFRV